MARVDRNNRTFFGDQLIGMAHLHESQALALRGLTARNDSLLSPKEVKYIKAAIAYLDKSNSVMRKIGNHLRNG